MFNNMKGREIKNKTLLSEQIKLVLNNYIVLDKCNTILFGSLDT